jgi:hypothetical protein
MAEYLLIESRDPFEFANVGSNYQQAADLARAGNKVTLLLVQNAVLAARLGAIVHGLKETAKSGVTILVDEFSLRERAIAADALIPEVSPTPLDLVIDKLAAGCKAVWR